MTFPGRNEFQWGVVQYPLPTGTSQPTVLTADPAISNILLFLATVLQTYVGARFAQDAAAAGLQDAAGNPITSPILQTVPYSPADYLQEEQFHFPLLSLDRISETFGEKTREYYDVSTKCQLLYMLPPLTASQMVQMNSYRYSAARTIVDRLMLGYDASWKNSAILYQVAGFESLSCDKGTWVGIQNPKNIKTFFPSYMMELTLRERQMPIDGQFPPLTSVDGTIDWSDGYAPNNLNINLFDLKLP